LNFLLVSVHFEFSKAMFERTPRVSTPPHRAVVFSLIAGDQMRVSKSWTFLTEFKQTHSWLLGSFGQVLGQFGQ
jgi:hypothetical protein